MALSTRERFWRIVGEHRQLFVALLFVTVVLFVLTLFAAALGVAGSASTETAVISGVNVALLGTMTLLIAYVLRRAPR